MGLKGLIEGNTVKIEKGSKGAKRRTLICLYTYATSNQQFQQRSNQAHRDESVKPQEHS